MTFPLDKVKDLVDEDKSLSANTFSRRCDFILRDLADPDSYLSKPPGGSSDTLENQSIKGDKAKAILDTFAHKWLTANRMSMVLVSKHDLNQIEEIAKSSFGYIRRCDTPLPRFMAVEPFHEHSFCKIIEVKGEDDDSALRLSWPMVPQEPNGLKTRTLDYFTFLLSSDDSESSSSLYKTLGEQGFLNEQS